MQRITLSFRSIFVASEFKREANVMKAKVKVNLLIGELQATVAGLNTFEQLAAGINAVIETSKPKTP